MLIVSGAAITAQPASLPDDWAEAHRLCAAQLHSREPGRSGGARVCVWPGVRQMGRSTAEPGALVVLGQGGAAAAALTFYTGRFRSATPIQADSAAQRL